MIKDRLKEVPLSFDETYLFLFFNYNLNARLRRVRSKSAKTELLEGLIVVVHMLL